MKNPEWALRQSLTQKPEARHVLGRFLWDMRQRRYRRLQRHLGFFLPLSAQFDGPPIFPHGVHGIFVSGEARIGRDCVIFHQVTIGSNAMIDSRGLGAPRIGDRCYIGAGAKIIGGVLIGNDVRIGANAIVTRDVPDFSTVTGNNHVHPSERPRDNRLFSVHGEQCFVVENGKRVAASLEDSTRLRAAFRRRSYVARA